MIKKPLTFGVDLFSVLLVSVLMIAPICNVLYRTLFNTSLTFSASIAQHATLWVCFIGAAIASRTGNLLCLGDLSKFCPKKVQPYIKMAVDTLIISITALMFISSIKMIHAEYLFGKSTNFNVPIWLLQLALPIGYGLIVLRTLQAEHLSWKQKIVVYAIPFIIIGMGQFEELQTPFIISVSIIFLLVMSFFHLPIFITLGGMAILMFWYDGTVISSFSTEIYTKISTNDTLAALPLFTLAGYIMAEGGAPRRLVNLFQDMFSWIPGGIAIATIAVCTFFTTFTGASGVTILAMGGLLKPALDSRGYQEKTSLGLITGSSSLGVLFPPSLPLILYGAVALQPITDMFLGAFIPGMLLFFLVVGYGMYRGFIELSEAEPFSYKKCGKSLWGAKWEAILPVFVLSILFSGFANLTETAALTVLYAICCEFIIHRDLKFRKDFVRVISYSTVLIGGVLIILTSAVGLTNYLIDAEIPLLVIEYVQEHITNPLVFLFYLNIFLFMAGCIMDVFTAIVVISPLLIPLAQSFEINPVHIGVVFLMNLGVGYLTPPVGMNLFISSYRFKKPLSQICIASLPIFIISVIAVLIITYVPWFSTVLLDYVGGPTNVNIQLDKF